MTLCELYWACVVLLFGGCFGSFLNVCVYRIPQELSLSHPPSACPKCGTPIKWYDNVPVFGWIFLLGKCRACKAPIAIRYPLVELLTALLFLGIWLMYGASWVAAVYALAVFGLLLATFIDLDEMWLPDRVTIGGMIAYPIFSYFLPALHGAETRAGGLTASLIGLAVGFGTFWGVGLIGKLIFKKDAMGFGDVKLMGGLGALLGWQSVIFILFVSSLFGSIVGVSLIAMEKKEMSSRIPYGPYLALAAMTWIFGGYRLWDAYLNFIAGG
jgi:leader peptidase (prepilin peptidase)/N-methyltransferase